MIWRCDMLNSPGRCARRSDRPKQARINRLRYRRHGRHATGIRSQGSRADETEVDRSELASVDPTDARNGIVPRYAIPIATGLFFKKFKSTLDFHQYQFQALEPVDDWAELGITTFMYLEWYRRHQMSRCDLSGDQKRR